MQTLLFIYTGGGTLLALLSLPLLAGKIRPNPFYGFRARKTLENPVLWYSINKYFAKLQLLVALIIIITSFGFSNLPGISTDQYALSVLAVFIIAFFTAFMLGWQHMKNLK